MLRKPAVAEAATWDPRAIAGEIDSE